MFDIAARQERLAMLACALRAEALRVELGLLPLDYPIRRLYVDALRRASAGLESARVALAAADWRLRDEVNGHPVSETGA